MPTEVSRSTKPARRPGFEVVALAASAGGLRALVAVLEEIPDDFPAAIVVVQHLDPRHPSLIAGILNRHCALPVREASNGETLRQGQVYVAPPDHHLLINRGGIVSLTQTELVHFVRPSADLLFESLAASYKERAIAVVLSGTGQDGAMGVRAIKKMGGAVLVQDARTAEFSGMPEAAIQTDCVDRVLPLSKIASTLVELVTREQLDAGADE